MPALFRHVLGMKGSENASDQKFRGHGNGSDDSGDNKESGGQAPGNRFMPGWPKGRWGPHKESSERSNVKTDYDNDIHNPGKIDDLEMGVPTRSTTIDHVSGMRTNSAAGIPPTIATPAAPTNVAVPSGEVSSDGMTEKSRKPKWYVKRDLNYEILERV